MIFNQTDFKRLCNNYRKGYFESEFQNCNFYEIHIKGNNVFITENPEKNTNPTFCSNNYFPFGNYLINILKEKNQQ